MAGYLQLKEAAKKREEAKKQQSDSFISNIIKTNTYSPSNSLGSQYKEPERNRDEWGNPVAGPMYLNATTNALEAPKLAPQNTAPSAISTAEQYKKMALAAAAQEEARRRAAAQNLYDSTLANLATEEGTIDPEYQEALRYIKEGAFENTEAQKEIMNQYGWGMGDTGLAVGEVNKIAINQKKSEATTTTKRAQALADIARRRTLASQLLNNTNDDTESWKAAQVQGVEAQAFLKAAEEAKQNARDAKLDKIAQTQIELQEAGLRGEFKDGTKTASQKQYLDTKQMAANQFFTNSTGYARINDSMIGQDDPLRNASDYSAIIKEIEQNQNWKDDPASRYTMAAATYLRNQKINSMKESNPGLYDQYKGSINYDGELIPTAAYEQWNKSFNEDKQQRDFTNDMTVKTFNRTGEQWDKTFNETVRSNIIDEGFKNRQVGVSEAGLGLERDRLELQKAAQKRAEAKENKSSEPSTVVSAAYSDFVSSGKLFDEWINTTGKNGVAYGQVLTDKEIAALIDLAKTTGKFNAKTSSSLESLLGIGGN